MRGPKPKSETTARPRAFALGGALCLARRFRTSVFGLRPFGIRREFSLKPGLASFDLSGRRPFMKSTGSQFFPTEVFHRIRQIDAVALNSCILHGLVETMSRRSDKRKSIQVLFVPRLFPDDRKGCRGRSFSEDGLCGTLVKFAALAIFH